MIYLSELEKNLGRSKKGFGLFYLEGETLIEQIPPGLIYTDIVICAGNRYELQGLIDICSRGGDKLGLQFSKEKLGIMVFNDVTRKPIKVRSKRPLNQENREAKQSRDDVIGTVGTYVAARVLPHARDRIT